MVIPAILGPPPTWDSFRGKLESSGWSPQMKTAGRFAFDTLEERLGSNWPARTARNFVIPAAISRSNSHLFAVARLVELALRLDELRDCHGAGKLKTTLQTNPREEALVHATIQLEVGALAQSLGWNVEVEAYVESTTKPVDVFVRRGPEALTAEAKAILPDEGFQKTNPRSDQLIETVTYEERGGVAIGGWVDCPPDEAGLVILEQEIMSAARLVRERKVTMLLRRPGVHIDVVPEDPEHPSSFEIHVPIADQWTRLRYALTDKAKDQMKRSGARWLRVDCLHHLWELGPLTRLSLPQRLDVLRRLVEAWMEPYPHVHGVVLSNGASMMTPSVVPEEALAGSGAVLMSVPLDSIRTRETVIVPLRKDSWGVTAWAELYRSETNWLRGALARREMDLPRELRPLGAAAA